MVALVVEDGSNTAGANSYADLATLRAYALARGVTLSATDADVEILAIQAMDYIESYRDRFQGQKTYENLQPLQWPRKVVYIDCFLIDEDTMPSQLADMQGQLVIELHNGVSLQPTQTESFITKEKVDVIEVEYSDNLRTSGQPRITSVEAYLDALITPCGPGAPLDVLRV